MNVRLEKQSTRTLASWTRKVFTGNTVPIKTAAPTETSAVVCEAASGPHGDDNFLLFCLLLGLKREIAAVALSFFLD